MTALTLYELEENLTPMAQTADLAPSEVEAEFIAAFQAALLSAADNRDRVSQFLSHVWVFVRGVMARITSNCAGTYS